MQTSSIPAYAQTPWRKETLGFSRGKETDQMFSLPEIVDEEGTTDEVLRFCESHLGCEQPPHLRERAVSVWAHYEKTFTKKQEYPK